MAHKPEIKLVFRNVFEERPKDGEEILAANQNLTFFMMANYTIWNEGTEDESVAWSPYGGSVQELDKFPYWARIKDGS